MPQCLIAGWRRQRCQSLTTDKRSLAVLQDLVENVEEDVCVVLLKDESRSKTETDFAATIDIYTFTHTVPTQQTNQMPVMLTRGLITKTSYDNLRI